MVLVLALAVVGADVQEAELNGDEEAYAEPDGLQVLAEGAEEYVYPCSIGYAYYG